MGNCGIYVKGSGKATLSGGTVNGSKYGVRANGNATVTISGSNITTENNHAKDAAVWVQGSASLTVSGGSITGENTGGIGVNANATVKVSGGAVTGKSFGLYAAGDADVEVSDGAITGEGAYGIWASGNAKVTVSGGTITGGDYAVCISGTGTAAVTVAGNAELNAATDIYTVRPVIASGRGVSSLDKVYTISYKNIADGITVVKGSTDNTHYRLQDSGYTLVPEDGNLVARQVKAVTGAADKDDA